MKDEPESAFPRMPTFFFNGGANGLLRVPRNGSANLCPLASDPCYSPPPPTPRPRSDFFGFFGALKKGRLFLGARQKSPKQVPLAEGDTRGKIRVPHETPWLPKG